MAKRKRQQAAAADLPVAATKKPQSKKVKIDAKTPAKNAGPNGPSTATTVSTAAATTKTASGHQTETLQIIAGSYDQVLHGMTATLNVRDGSEAECQFADTFLFNAHSSAVRCVAVSPVSPPVTGQLQKVLLATGSTDERIHVYSLCAHPPRQEIEVGDDDDDDDDKDGNNTGGASKSNGISLLQRRILENPRNRELGTLLHHTSTVTALRFPTRTKLLSASDDSTMAVARSRDWSVLSTIRVPVPKKAGRPSGDTAPLGLAPSGVNDLAVHPSMKLMISVSRGERCMRLWNLVTGKKAGVLAFARDVLAQAGEGKHSSGEGRRVVWGHGSTGGEGEEESGGDGADEFAVAFERDVVVFGMDSVPRCRVMPFRTKLHQLTYITVPGKSSSSEASVLAVSTEDGRILFFSTREKDLVDDKDGEDGGKVRETQDKTHPDKKEENRRLPLAKLIGQLGGKEAGVTSRVKDFVVLRSGVWSDLVYVVAASSDGKVRVWTVTDEVLRGGSGGGKAGVEMGRLVGVYETMNRITCLTGFVMVPRPDGVEDSEEEDGGRRVESDESESESEDEGE